MLLGGVDVRELDLTRLRSAVGVVTQRTEILAGTLADNITLFADTPRPVVESAVDELGLSDKAKSDHDLVEAILAHPILMERPVVIGPRGVRLCRPAERVREVLPPAS